MEFESNYTYGNQKDRQTDRQKQKQNEQIYLRMSIVLGNGPLLNGDEFVDPLFRSRTRPSDSESACERQKPNLLPYIDMGTALLELLSDGGPDDVGDMPSDETMQEKEQNP